MNFCTLSRRVEFLEVYERAVRTVVISPNNSYDRRRVISLLNYRTSSMLRMT